MPCCCAVGCSMKAGTNLLSKISFYRFPKDPERHQLWKSRVNRKDFTPGDYARLCSRHFVSGKPSKDPDHPDWAPSIFHHTTRSDIEQRLKGKKRMGRFERRTKRQKQEDICSPGSSNTHQQHEDVCSPGTSNTHQQQDELVEIESEEVENITLGTETQTDLSSAEIQNIIQENFELKERIKFLEEQIKQNTESLSSKILNNEKQIKFYTGLSKKDFKAILEYFLEYNRPKVSTSLAYDEQLLVVLMRLKLGLSTDDLSYRFEIRWQIFCQIFHAWINVLSIDLKQFIIWPTKQCVKKNLPKVFQNSKYCNVRCIIDCFEIFIQRPTALTARAQTYSSYKSHNTAKVLIGISPSGGITYLSSTWGGRTSDREIVQRSDFLTKVECGDVILADRGFTIADLLANRGAKLIIPAFTRGKPQLSREEVEVGRQISRARIHVERVIGRLKSSYRILQTTLPISTIKRSGDRFLCSLDKILIVCAALVNLRPPILK